jgi:hypothetical protein
MVKIITHPTTGQTICFGRNRPKIPHHQCRTSFKDMIAAGVLPSVTVPEFTHYQDAASPSLSNIYKNDVWGCCVIAGGFHERGLTSFNAGNGVVFTDQQVSQDYSAIGGFDPNAPLVNGVNPTDNGCDEVTALDYWRATGFPDGVHIIKDIAIDPTDPEEFQLALYLFESLQFCMELPDGWVSPMPTSSGFIWDVAGAPDENNGHCVAGCDIVPGGIIIDSWAMTGTLTNAAIAYYASPAQNGSLFVGLTNDIVSKVRHKSPIGFNMHKLKHYISNLP